MKTALIAGYPKSGNTLLGETLNIAGGVKTSYEYYTLRDRKTAPSSNPLLGSEICSIKSHEMLRYGDKLHSMYFGPVINVVTIVRNPFETLLSALNFFRVVYDTYSVLPPLHIRSLKLLLPDYEITSAFSDQFTIEALRDDGQLSIALESFAEMGSSLLHFYQMSGPWCSFVSSYANCGVPVLNLRYEDLVLESMSSSPEHSLCSRKLSEFWSCDFESLKKGFVLQSHRANYKKSQGNAFYPKARSGYWSEYFSLSECRKFADVYHRALIDNGYDELLDQIFPHPGPVSLSY
jgi:hypothetical protein